MTDTPTPRRRRVHLPETPVIVAAVVTIVLLSLVAIPKQERAGYSDPVAEAADAYRSLLSGMGTSGERTGTNAGPDSSTGGRTRLDRSLFEPKPTPKPRSMGPVSVTKSKPKPPPPPALTGLLIDGESRHALLSGEIVKEGDTVGGYKVVRIESDAVLIVREGHVHRLEMKGSQR